MNMGYPLKFEPLLKVRVWGGDALPKLYGQDFSDPVGESWAITDHDEDVSTIVNGELAGSTLRDLLESDQKALAGDALDPKSPDKFPLMLKILDSRDNLSVQVHPGDDYASMRKPGELGKTEAWYILSADEGACIYHGLKEGVSAADLEAAMKDGVVEKCLNRIEVNKGEVYHIPSGVVHALGAGVRIAEIQQNSDTTYRLFDWNRVGLDGKARELHIEDGLAVSDFSGAGGKAESSEIIPLDGAKFERFVVCDKFVFEKLSGFTGSATLDTEKNSFHIVCSVSGNIKVSAGDVEETLGLWESCLIPACAGKYSVSGDSESEALIFHKGIK